ncbi:hypothetical protein BDQ17DRAFT_1412993 [Cyathus striatus]|nr:hypothetical protein BDQ17DRAFT_1412993 [Cyathus striatus]
MLTTLPAELILQILSYLPLKSISSIRQLNKAWEDFVNTNSSNVFRNASIVHGFVGRNDALLSDVLEEGVFRGRVARGVKGWEDWCRRRVEMGNSWLAHAPSYIRLYDSLNHKAVHRIKVDEGRGFIITTSQMGGLTVVDMESGEWLWGLPGGYVRPFAHVEYEAGYLIFDRSSGSKEVWRLSSLPTLPTPPHAPPDENLLAASTDTLYIFNIPTATLVSTIMGLQNPELGDLNYVDLSARHVFVAAQRGVRVFSRQTGGRVLDLPSDKWEYGRRVGLDTMQGEEKGFVCGVSEQMYEDEDEVQEDDGDVDYEDYYEDEWDVSVASRRQVWKQRGVASGTSQKESGLPLRTWETRWGGDRVRDAMAVEHRVVVDRVPSDEEQNRGRRVVDEFIAVHVSRDGKHFVALLSNSRVVLVHNFEQAIAPTPPPPSKAQTQSGSTSTFGQQRKVSQSQEGRQAIPLEDLTLDFQLGSRRSPSVYLAFEDDRVAVVTQSALWVVHVHPPASFTYTNTSVYPTLPIRITRVPGLNTPWHLARVSCLQLSPTGLYVNWQKDTGCVLSDAEWIGVDDRFADQEELEQSMFESDDEQSSMLRIVRDEPSTSSSYRGSWMKRQNEERFEREFWSKIGEGGCYASTPQGDLIVLDDGIQVGMDLQQNTVAAVEFAPRWCVNINMWENGKEKNNL